MPACEVGGLPLWEKLEPATVAGLRELWSRWGVLVFRRQALDEAELAAFCALFGPLERIVRTDWASPVVPEIGVISNLKDGQGRAIGGVGDGGMHGHSDPSHIMQPPTGARPFGLELPPRGRAKPRAALRPARPPPPPRL